MENQTRFDLNAAIENWRQELAGQPNLASDDRRELETHLRDAIAEFQQHGLNVEEAFWLARRRVGQPQQLGEEFVKANPAKVWRERVFWMALAALVLTLAGTSADCVFNSLFKFGFLSHFLNSSFTLERYKLVFVGFRLLVYWLPVSICVWMFASGRLAFNSPRLGEFFHSRRHLGMAAMAWILMNMGVQFVQEWQPHARLPFDGYSGAVFLVNLFLFQVPPLLLLALLVWLVPGQVRKTTRPV